jgi:hypothetical protein
LVKNFGAICPKTDFGNPIQKNFVIASRLKAVAAAFRARGFIVSTGDALGDDSQAVTLG